MKPVTERDIRSSFVNCSKGDAKRLHTPRNLADQPWDDLDFLGWSDPSLPGRCYVVAPQADRRVGVAMRHETGGSGRAQMCTNCLTTHTGSGARYREDLTTEQKTQRVDTNINAFLTKLSS